MVVPPPDLREAGGGGVTATRRQAALGIYNILVVGKLVEMLYMMTEERY